MISLPPWRAALAGFLTFTLLSASSPAQEPAAPSAPIFDVDKIAAEVSRYDEELRKSFDETRTIVSAELAAKRLDAATAQSLLWSLRANSNNGFAVPRNVVTAPGAMPTANAAVVAAMQKLEATSNQYQNARAKLSREALPLAFKQTVAVARTAEKPEEIDAVLAPLGRLEELLGSRMRDGFTQSAEMDLKPAVALLHNLQTVLTTRENGDPKLLGMAITRFQTTPLNETVGWTTIDTQKRVDAFLKPYFDAMQPAQAALDQALLNHRSAKELASALAHFEEVNANLQAVRGPSNSFVSTNNSFKNPLETYRTLVGLARQVEDGDVANLRINIMNGRQSLNSLGIERAHSFELLFQQWQKQIDDTANAETAKQHAAWAARLAAVKTPVDLVSVAADMQRAEHADTTPGSSIRYRSSGILSTQLASLAAAWSSANPGLATGGFQGAENETYGQEMIALRERIQRDVLSQTLRVPELLKPPFADQPINVALDALVRQFSEAREWRRLLALLEMRSGGPGYGVQNRLGDGDAVNAIRSFLAGQNYELAEQWTDAITAYRAVLATTTEIGPIKEAAGRLKVLTKEHGANGDGPTAASPNLHVKPVQN